MKTQASTHRSANIHRTTFMLWRVSTHTSGYRERDTHTKRREDTEIPRQTHAILRLASKRHAIHLWVARKQNDNERHAAAPKEHRQECGCKQRRRIPKAPGCLLSFPATQTRPSPSGASARTRLKDPLPPDSRWCQEIGLVPPSGLVSQAHARECTHQRRDACMCTRARTLYVDRWMDGYR